MKSKRNMEKIKLHAIGNDGNYNYYTFDKTNNVAKLISKILKKSLDVRLKLHKEKHDKNDDYVSRKINFNKRKEGHERINGSKKKVRVDIFYGKKKMFIIVHCSLNLRKKLNEEIGKMSYVPKIKK